CGDYSTFHKLTDRRAFSCARCGAHTVYPTAGTVFQDTCTPLQVWFYAIYLFVTTRHGVSGKQLQRTLGVTHKTAWRMFKNSIRSTHIHVSEKYVDRYLKEFTFRSNHRGMVNAMFDLLIASM